MGNGNLSPKTIKETAVVAECYADECRSGKHPPGVPSHTDNSSEDINKPTEKILPKKMTLHLWEAKSHKERI